MRRLKKYRYFLQKNSQFNFTYDLVELRFASRTDYFAKMLSDENEGNLEIRCLVNFGYI